MTTLLGAFRTTNDTSVLLRIGDTNTGVILILNIWKSSAVGDIRHEHFGYPNSESLKVVSCWCDFRYVKFDRGYMIGDKWIPKTELNTQKSQLLESLKRSTSSFCMVCAFNSRLHKQRSTMKYLFQALMLAYFVAAFTNSDQMTNPARSCNVNNYYTFSAGPNCKKIENVMSEVKYQLTELKQQIMEIGDNQTGGPTGKGLQ